MLHRKLGARIVALAVALGTTVSLSGLASAATLVGIAGAPRPVKTIPTTPVTSPTATTAPGPVVTLPVITPVTGVFEPMPAPLSPGVYPLQTSEDAVVVHWYDRSIDETSFIVYRAGSTGNWQNVYQVATRDEAGQGDDYSWVDTDTNQSGQCYMIAAVGLGGSGYTSEQCTVRPDPAQFPQSVPSPAVQWYGLSGTNDGTGPLVTATRDDDTNLKYGGEGIGVDLSWGDSSLWKVQAPGGDEIMYGEKVALRVWGGGWLKWGSQTFGTDLQLSDTPAYEWYILGPPPGGQVDSEEFALWNSTADAYLVFHHETWGVDLEWDYGTSSSGSSSAPPASGVSQFTAYNCDDDYQPDEMWVDDLTAGTGWVDMGTIDTAWVDGLYCEGTADNEFTFTPTSGHSYIVRAVDLDCGNDPTNGDCERSNTTFTGYAGGAPLVTPV